MRRAGLGRLYAELLGRYGPQGWWPIPSRAGSVGFDDRGYHQGAYDEPRSVRDRFEVIVGAVLTQNTAWRNVESALSNLRQNSISLPRHIGALSGEKLGGLIRPSGYFNQKAKKLRIVADFFEGCDSLESGIAPAREDLLGLWGVGPETADAILLYVFREPLFVVDAYTRRLLGRMGFIAGSEGYSAVQGMFHAALPHDPEQFSEYHALIVEHAKRHCRARPQCAQCPVSRCRARDRTT